MAMSSRTLILGSLGLGVAGFEVRMALFCNAPIGFLDFGIAGAFGYAKHRIWIVAHLTLAGQGQV